MSPSSDVQKKVNKMVQFMLQVQYDYTAIITDLNKEDQTQIGVRKYVKKMIKTLQSDIQTLITIQQDWEGDLEFTDLKAPSKFEFDSVLEVLTEVLEKEKKINKKLVELHSKLVRNPEETSTAEEAVLEMVHWRDNIIQQIVEHIIHLEQNHSKVGEFSVSQMMQEEHSRLKETYLQKQQLKRQSLLPTTPMQQRKQLSSSTSSKRIILTPKRLQQKPCSFKPRSEQQLLKLKKF